MCYTLLLCAVEREGRVRRGGREERGVEERGNGGKRCRVQQVETERPQTPSGVGSWRKGEKFTPRTESHIYIILPGLECARYLIFQMSLQKKQKTSLMQTLH